MAQVMTLAERRAMRDELMAAHDEAGLREIARREGLPVDGEGKAAVAWSIVDGRAYRQMVAEHRAGELVRAVEAARGLLGGR